MRAFCILTFAVLFPFTAFAAALRIDVDRNGFDEPIDVSVAPRVEGRLPEWSAKKTLPPGKSSLTFDVAEGLYIVLASGPRPLQRLSTRTNVGTDGTTVHLTIPKTETLLCATLAGEPLPHAEISLTHFELRWRTKLETGEDGRFAGPLWEPALYTANVYRDHESAPHAADVMLSAAAAAIDVPDRHVRGRVVGEDGKPIAGAMVNLRSENSRSTHTVRTHTAPDGVFEFFGVREGSHTLTARAPSYVDSDAVRFELRGAPALRSVDVALSRGEPRVVRVVDARGHAIGGATLITSCKGDVKSTAVTNADGSANVALPKDASCAIYALPQEGSIAVGRFDGGERPVIRVPDGTSSLRLLLKTDTGEAFSDLRLLMRIDGMVVPPEIARLLGAKGFSLATNEEGSVLLKRIPAGTYEFWPYRTTAEGQLLYETAADFAAPISVKVLTGENNATVRFQAR
jgi:hypothetical protein